MAIGAPRGRLIRESLWESAALCAVSGALGYGIAAGVIGGLTPLLASSLFLWAKSPWPIALYLVGVGVISMIAVIVSPSFGSEPSLQETPLAGALPR